MYTKALIPVAGIKFISNTHYHYISITSLYHRWKLRILSAKSQSCFVIVKKTIIHSHWGISSLSFWRNSVSKIRYQKLAEIQLNVRPTVGLQNTSTSESVSLDFPE